MRPPIDDDALYADYLCWMKRAAGHANDDPLARMLAGQRHGKGVLSATLGMPQGDFRELVRFHFPAGPPPRVRGAPTQEPPADPTREQEFGDVRALLLEHRAGASCSEAWIAEIVARACLGGEHLWRDLGLWSRDDLSGLLEANFPALVRRNEHDMKWKKFFYKQLCDASGAYVCRAPSCEYCAGYLDCFGPED